MPFVWRAIANRLLDFLQPATCEWCQREVPAADASSIRLNRLCRACALTIAPSVARACLCCGAPVGPHSPRDGCPDCRDQGLRFVNGWSLGAYELNLRSAVLRTKQSGGDGLTAALADELWWRNQQAMAAAGIDLVIPVPHYWTSRVTRGHLPPVTMAEVISGRLGIPWSNQTLRKVRWTKKQAELTMAQRRLNLRRAFAPVPWHNLTGVHVLIVDDVMTTGTTLRRCSRALRRAGAKEISIATLARGGIRFKRGKQG